MWDNKDAVMPVGRMINGDWMVNNVISTIKRIKTESQLNLIGSIKVMIRFITKWLNFYFLLQTQLTNARLHLKSRINQFEEF